MSEFYKHDRIAGMRYYLRKGFAVRVTVAKSFRELFGLESARSSLLNGLALRDTRWQGFSLHAQQSGGFVMHDNKRIDYRPPTGASVHVYLTTEDEEPVALISSQL